jgi:DNA-binding LacI/PurR family transcriptional regulator
MPADRRGVDAVDLDFAAAARALVDHLADAGHRRATFVTWPEEIYASGRTYAWRFRDASLAEAERRGLDLDVVSGPSGAEPVRAVLAAVISRPDSPRALLLHNDAAVAMLPIVTRDLGLAVPGDLAVASLHSAELGQQFALPYTSVESQPGVVAELAVELLVQRLAAPGREPVAELVSPRMTVRASV